MYLPWRPVEIERTVKGEGNKVKTKSKSAPRSRSESTPSRPSSTLTQSQGLTQPSPDWSALNSAHSWLLPTMASERMSLHPFHLPPSQYVGAGLGLGFWCSDLVTDERLSCTAALGSGYRSRPLVLVSSCDLTANNNPDSQLSFLSNFCSYGETTSYFIEIQIVKEYDEIEPDSTTLCLSCPDSPKPSTSSSLASYVPSRSPSLHVYPTNQTYTLSQQLLFWSLTILHYPSRSYLGPATGYIFGEDGVEGFLPNFKGYTPALPNIPYGEEMRNWAGFGEKKPVSEPNMLPVHVKEGT